MSASIGVVVLRPWWAPWRRTDMDTAAVASALRPLLGELPDESSGEAIEVDHEGRRIATHWMLYRGRSGISRVSLSMRSAPEAVDAPGMPDAALREEAGAVFGRLRALASATGAKLFIDGADVTDATWDEALSLLA